MQTTSNPMLTALSAHETGGQSFDLVELCEIYAYNYTPGAGGFDPSQAEKRFCGILGFTFLGLAYERQYVDREDVKRYFGTQENSVTLNFSNTDRSFAQWIQTHNLAGKWLVLRVVSAGSSAVLADSLVIFCGRLDKPGDFDDTTATLTATQRFGQLNQQFPPRTFSPNDSKGRDPADPLFEGFRFTPVQSLVQWVTRDPRMNGFGLLLGLKKHTTHSLQASSQSNYTADQAVPDAFGRVQLPHVYLGTIDIGNDINFIIAFCEGGDNGIDSVENIRQINPKFSQISANPAIRLGYPGGQGPVGFEQVPVRSVHPTFNIPGDGYYSYTVWMAGFVQGSTPDVDEAQAPSFLAVIKAKRIKTPDNTGAWNVVSWSDNAVDIARHIISQPRYFNEGDSAMEDAANYQSWLDCNEYILDRTNGERAFIPQADAAQQGTQFQRYNSTGVINSGTIRQRIIGDLTGDPVLNPITVEPFDPVNPPGSIALKPVLRKRFTCNATCTERQTAVDYLNNTIAPTGRLYFVRNGKGRIEIRVEKPAENTRIRSAVTAGDTTVKVLDVEPWKSGALLLTQKLLVGAGLTTSEVRNVTAANYTSDGNAITLAVSVTGGVTAVASGATFSGGSSSVAASATITVGGTPAAGDTVTVTINNISFTFTVDANPTTVSVAAMIAYWIQAHPALRQFIKATWDGTSAVVNLAARYGVLTLDSALANTHAAQVPQPSSAPTLSPGVGGVLPAGTWYLAYTYVTASGESTPSPVASASVGAGQLITVDFGFSLTLPAGVLAVNWYVSKYANTDELVLYLQNNGASFNFGQSSLPDSTKDLVPDTNTTGEEILRVCQSFAANDQGATVLAQTGLTRGNVHAGTAKWPLGDRQSTVNQLKGAFYNATDDFAQTPLEVNDFDHQAETRKIDSQDVDLSGFDNLNQASRHLQFMLAKLRDGDFFVSKSTGPLAMLLEEGDVICESFDNGGFVNLPVRIEELSIGPAPTFTVQTVSRLYSTLMFSDNVRRHAVRLPTTLRAVTPLPTLWEFIDLGPTNDADSQTPGVYIVAAYDSSAQGSAKGWQLWADFGSGYRELIQSDIWGTLGTSSGTLASATPDTYYSDQTITGISLKLGSFDTTVLSSSQLAADPQAHLIAYGNEYIQYHSASFNSGAGLWTLTGLYRGRLGTQAISHIASERVVVMDSAVLVPLPAEALSVSANYKGVTINEDEVSVTPKSLTWTGGTIKFPPPTVEGTIDPTGTWRFRVAGVATNEPGGVRLKLTVVGSPRAPWILRGGVPRPLSLHTSPHSLSGSVNLSGNSVSNPISGNVAYAPQLITGEGSVLSVTYSTNINAGTATSGDTYIELLGSDSTIVFLSIRALSSTETPYLKVTDSIGGGATLFIDTTGEVNGTRYSIEFVDGKIKFYRNRTKYGAPFFTYSLPNTYQYPTGMRFSPAHLSAATTTLSDIELQDDWGAVVYPVAEQTADFGSAQSSLTVQGCQQRVVQGVVYDGAITQITLP